MARKKKDNIEQNDIQVEEQITEQVIEQKQVNNKENNKQNKDIIVQDTRTLEQKLNSYKRKLRRI